MATIVKAPSGAWKALIRITEIQPFLNHSVSNVMPRIGLERLKMKLFVVFIFLKATQKEQQLRKR